jgi:hypothetical protein
MERRLRQASPKQLTGETIVTDNNNTQAEQQPPKPNPALKSLDRLVGAWNMSGPDIKGQVRFEWLEGGFFLMQHVDLEHNGHKIKGIEIIGYEREFGATEPNEDIRSHWFGNTGDTFAYVYEVDDDTLAIWGGEKGSPAFYKGKWKSNGNTHTVAWVYSGG